MSASCDRKGPALRRVAIGLLIGLFAAGNAVAAASVWPVHEQLGLTALVDSELVDSRQPDAERLHDFVYGAAELGRGGALRADESARVLGRRSSETLLVASNFELGEAFDHYQAQIAAAYAIAFECSGRDCGRSTAWANHVFGVGLLNGPNRSQRLLSVAIPRVGAAAEAAEDAQTSGVLTIYGIRRGNGRTYLHLEFIAVATAQIAQLLPDTTGQWQWEVGFDYSCPSADAPAAFSAEQTAQLQRVLRQAKSAGHDRAQVVCHCFGTAPVEALIAQSQTCAEAAVAALGPTGATLPELIPVGAGASAPRFGMQSRVEVVLRASTRAGP